MGRVIRPVGPQVVVFQQRNQEGGGDVLIFFHFLKNNCIEYFCAVIASQVSSFLFAFWESAPVMCLCMVSPLCDHSLNRRTTKTLSIWPNLDDGVSNDADGCVLRGCVGVHACVHMGVRSREGG